MGLKRELRGKRSAAFQRYEARSLLVNLPAKRNLKPLIWALLLYFPIIRIIEYKDFMGEKSFFKKKSLTKLYISEALIWAWVKPRK